MKFTIRWQMLFLPRTKSFLGWTRHLFLVIGILTSVTSASRCSTRGSIRPRVLADSDEAILTLVTCYPFYFVGSAPRRFVVRARRIRLG